MDTTNHLIEAKKAIQQAEDPNNIMRERHMKLAIGHALIALVQEVGLLRESLEDATEQNMCELDRKASKVCQ